MGASTDNCRRASWREEEEEGTLQPTDCTAPFCLTASVLGSWGARGVGSSWMAGSNSGSSPGMNLRFAGGDFFAALPFPLCLFLRFEPACFACKLPVLLPSTDAAEAALDESQLAGGV